MGLFPWAPVVDKDIELPRFLYDIPDEEWRFLEEDPITLLRNKQYNHNAQIMTGVNIQDAAYFICKFNQKCLIVFFYSSLMPGIDGFIIANVSNIPNRRSCLSCLRNTR